MAKAFTLDAEDSSQVRDALQHGDVIEVCLWDEEDSPGEWNYSEAFLQDGASVSVPVLELLTKIAGDYGVTDKVCFMLTEEASGR